MTIEKLLKDVVGLYGGFLLINERQELARLDRLRQVLVRCNNCRFVCAVQDVEHLTAIINATEHDWVRDVSLLASDRAYNGDYLAVTAPPPAAARHVTTLQAAARQAARRILHGTEFNEAECGGAFDGFSVSSDADSGL